MSATRLLVLGLVRSLGRAHGYVISKVLMSWKVDEWANTKTGSIYHALRSLTKEHMLLSLEVAQSDLGPPRVEYEITPAGHDEFFSLMRQALSVPETRPDMLSSGLVFLTSLTRAEAIALFRMRVAHYETMRERIQMEAEEGIRSGPEIAPQHVESLFSFWTDWIVTGQRWSEEMITKLEGGAFVFADETTPPTEPVPGKS
jgi:DNA-binding PadR family transcriptional regulator